MPSKKIVRENYNEYIKNRDARLNQDELKWIYDIVDGNTEQETIILKTDDFVVTPSYVWDGKDIFKLHILSIVCDKSITCIRDLNKSHVPLLKSMRDMTLKKIKEVYRLDKCYIKMFIHYSPSTYLLHVHFVNIYNTQCNSSCEYSHELNSVIFNLKMNTRYYKLIELNTRT